MVTVLDTTKVKPRHPEKAHRPENPVQRKPDWIRVRAGGSPVYEETRKIVKENNLVTVPRRTAHHSFWLPRKMRLISR